MAPAVRRFSPWPIARLYEEKRERRPAAADRGRGRLLLASGLALAALAIAGAFEWRRLRHAPPPPDRKRTRRCAALGSPPAASVVRDEEELNRLREEVQRLQDALAQPRAVDDRGRYEARIRELEARLTEAPRRRRRRMLAAGVESTAAGGGSASAARA